jgi:hypothetical protein
MSSNRCGREVAQPGDLIGVGESIGFAKLAQGDSPMDLIDRADSDLIAARHAQRRDRKART